MLVALLVRLAGGSHLTSLFESRIERVTEEGALPRRLTHLGTKSEVLGVGQAELVTVDQQGVLAEGVQSGRVGQGVRTAVAQEVVAQQRPHPGLAAAGGQAQADPAVVGELQRNASQLMEDQTSRASQLIQDGMAELSHQTREHLGRVDDWQGQALDSATSGVTAIQDWGRMTADAMDQLPRPDLRLAPLPQAVQGVLPAGPM